MIKRYISAILAAVTVITCTAVTSWAFTGSIGQCKWQIKDGTLTVYGGNIPDYTASSKAPWYKFSSLVKKLVIGEGVTVIGARAFEDMEYITKADPGSVTKVGTMAFSGCKSLTSVTLPNSVTTIGDYAFAECSMLQSVKLSAELTAMGTGIFDGCPSLSLFSQGSERYAVREGVIIDTASGSVFRCPPARKTEYTVPSGITKVAPGAFRDCKYLTSVNLTGVSEIGSGAFYGCSSLTDVSIPDVQTVGNTAFYGSSSLTDISFGKKLSRLGDSAFAFCTALTRADFRGSAPTAGEDIFYGTGMGFTVVISAESTGFGDTEWQGYPLLRHGTYKGTAEKVTWELNSETGIMKITGEGAPIPNFRSADSAPWFPYRSLMKTLVLTGVTEIGDNSFRYSGLTTVGIPSGVTRIGKWAFSGCSSLKEFNAPYVKTVDECAFFGSVSLRTGDFSEAVSIGKQAFSGCTSLWYIFTGETAPKIGEFAFDLTDVSVLYPVGGTGYGSITDVYTEPYLAGDANGDGKRNVSDVTLLLKHIAKWNVSLNKISTDTNGDGKLNVTDATNIMKFIAKWDIEIGIRK